MLKSPRTLSQFLSSLQLFCWVFCPCDKKNNWSCGFIPGIDSLPREIRLETFWYLTSSHQCWTCSFEHAIATESHLFTHFVTQRLNKGQVPYTIFYLYCDGVYCCPVLGLVLFTFLCNNFSSSSSSSSSRTLPHLHSITITPTMPVGLELRRDLLIVVSCIWKGELGKKWVSRVL